MGQITATQNLVATKVVRLAGQQVHGTAHSKVNQAKGLNTPTDTLEENVNPIQGIPVAPHPTNILKDCL